MRLMPAVLRIISGRTRARQPGTTAQHCLRSPGRPEWTLDQHGNKTEQIQSAQVTLAAGLNPAIPITSLQTTSLAAQ
jgi:hypothetical protein